MVKYLHVQAKGRNIPYPSIKIAICGCSSQHSYGKIGSCQTKYPHQWNSISSPSCHIKNPPFFRAKIPIGIITIWINNVIIRQQKRNIPIKFIPLQIQGTSTGFLSQLFSRDNHWFIIHPHDSCRLSSKNVVELHNVRIFH